MYLSYQIGFICTKRYNRHFIYAAFAKGNKLKHGIIAE